MRARRFVGRTEQLAVLDEVVARAAAGEPSVALVGGDAGIGKTRLLQHVSERAERGGFRVLHGSCLELGAEGLPLAPVSAVLRSLTAQPGPDTLRDLLPGVDGLLRLLPELDPGQDGPVPLPRLFDLFMALLRLLGAARPVLLVVDDLQWADRSTRNLLDVLARALTPARVALLVAYRTDDLGRGHPLRVLLAQLDRLGHVRRLELGGLVRAETTDLVEGVLGPGVDPALIDRIYRRSEGNPLFAEELAVHLAGEARAPAPALPEFLQDLLLARFDSFADEARHVVRLAAVGGDRVTHPLLLATAPTTSLSQLLTGLEQAVDARMLMPDGDGYVFRHRLVRDAVLDDLLPAQRAALHRAFATALRADPGLVAPERLAAENAHHWFGAGERAMAFAATLQAADAAAKLSAHAERAQLLERALQVWESVPDADTGAERATLFETAVTAALWAGESLQALRLLDRALAERDRPGEPERLAMLLAQRGMVLHLLGRDGSVVSLDEAVALLPDAPSATRARVLDLASAVFALRGAPGRARNMATEAAAIAADLGDVALESNARINLGQALGLLVEPEAALRTLRTAEELAERSGDRIGVVRVRLNLAENLHALGRFEEAIGQARAGLVTAVDAGVERTLGALVAARLGALLCEVGRWDDAESVSRRALERDPPLAGGAGLHVVVAEVALGRGACAQAREHLAVARTLLGEGADGQDRHPALPRLEAALALLENRPDDAGTILLHALGSGMPGDWPLLVTGGAVLSSYRSYPGPSRPAEPVRDRATTLRAALFAARDRLPAHPPWHAAHAVQLAAELGEVSWSEAVQRWHDLGRPHAAAHARLQAAMVLGGRDRATGRELLRTAMATAVALRAEPLAADIRAYALAAHLTLDDTSGSGTARDDLDRLGLTHREVEVLRLLATGRSNRQIGGTLFISVKTASVHVSNILGKLGVASRGEAAAVAHRLRLFAGPDH